MAKLMSLAIDLVICGGANNTSGCHLAIFSEDVTLAHHFVVSCPPPTLPPCKSASGIDYPSKNYLKWRAIQLAIYSIVGAWIEYK